MFHNLTRTDVNPKIIDFTPLDLLLNRGEVFPLVLFSVSSVPLRPPQPTFQHCVNHAREKTLVNTNLCFAVLQASRKLHDRMAYAIFRSPMSFFDTTPIGRILNRFSRYVMCLPPLSSFRSCFTIPPPRFAYMLCSSDIYRVDEVIARTFNMVSGTQFLSPWTPKRTNAWKSSS